MSIILSFYKINTPCNFKHLEPIIKLLNSCHSEPWGQYYIMIIAVTGFYAEHAHPPVFKQGKGLLTL